MVLLNNSLLLPTSAGAALVIGGVVAKNTSEQLAKAGVSGVVSNATLYTFGLGAFTIGWILCAYAFSLGKPKQLSFILPCAGILLSVVAMKMMPKTPAHKAMLHMSLLPIIFAASWIALGYFVGNHFHGNMKYSGLLASALVLLSMMVVLPKQRMHHIVDGPGAYLFGTAWVILIALNSMR